MNINKKIGSPSVITKHRINYNHNFIQKDLRTKKRLRCRTIKD